MKTTLKRVRTLDPFDGAESKLTKMFRRVKKEEKLLARKKARIQKRLKQESYDWASLDAT